MKILIAVHTYYPANNGVQMVTQYMAEGLARHHEVLVITQRREEDGSETVGEHNHVRIERIRVERKGYRFAGEREQFLQRIREWEPDVLISVCTQSWPFDWLWGEFETLPCRKVLYTHGYSGLQEDWHLAQDLTHLHLRAFRYHAHWKWYYDRAYRYIAQYDLVTYLSENNISVRYAQQHGLTNGAILCNAVEDAFFEDGEGSAHRQRAAKGEEPVRFIYVANYDENKNQEMVLMAFAKALGDPLTEGDVSLQNGEKTAMNRAQMIFIGSSENAYYQKLTELAGETGAGSSPETGGRVFLLTGVDRAQIPRRLREADVFVCGSRKEQYPIMLCEAAAEGLAIISTDVGHASQMDGCEIVHSEEEMARAMRYFAGSAKERAERGRRLREYAQANYRIQDKVDWMEEQLTRLVSADRL